MELSVDNPQLLMLAGLVLLLLVALLARHVGHRKNLPTRSRFGEDHSQAITEMGNRTRLEAERKEREQLAETSPNLGH